MLSSCGALSPTRRRLIHQGTATTKNLFASSPILLKKPRYPHCIGEVDFHYAQQEQQQQQDDERFIFSSSSTSSMNNPNNNNYNNTNTNYNNHSSSFSSYKYSPHQKYLYLPLSAVTGGRLNSATENLLTDVARSRGFNSQFWITANQLYKRFDGGQVLESERDKGVDVGLGRGPMRLVNLDDVVAADAALFLRSFPLPVGAATVFDTEFDRPASSLLIPIGRHRVFDGLRWQRYRGSELNYALDALLKERYSNDDDVDRAVDDDDVDSFCSSPMPSSVTPNWIFEDVIESRKMLLKPGRAARSAYECFDAKAFNEMMEPLKQQQQHQSQQSSSFSRSPNSCGQHDFSGNEQDLWTQNATSSSSYSSSYHHPQNNNQYQQQQTTTPMMMKSFDQAWSSSPNTTTTMSPSANSVLQNLWNSAADATSPPSSTNNNNSDPMMMNNNSNNVYNNNHQQQSPPMMMTNYNNNNNNIASTSMSCIFFNAEQTNRYEEIEQMWARYLLAEDVARGNWDGTFMKTHPHYFALQQQQQQQQQQRLVNNNCDGNDFDRGTQNNTSTLTNHATTSNSMASASLAIAQASHQFWNNNNNNDNNNNNTTRTTTTTPLPPLSQDTRAEVLLNEEHTNNNCNNHNNSHNTINGVAPDNHSTLVLASSDSNNRTKNNNNTNTNTQGASFLSGFSKMPSRAKLNEADFAWSACMME